MAVICANCGMPCVDVFKNTEMAGRNPTSRRLRRTECENPDCSRRTAFEWVDITTADENGVHGEDQD